MSAPAAAGPVSSTADPTTVAEQLAGAFAEQAGVRDAERGLPHEQVLALKRSGLLALSVPTEYGGIDAPATTVTEVFRLLAHGDPSLAQIPQSHYTFLEALRLQGTAAQQEFFFGLVRDGALFANIQTERGPHAVNIDSTTLRGVSDGEYLLTGRKYYCTGALFADWLIVRASLSHDSDDQPGPSTPKVIVFVPPDATGVDIVVPFSPIFDQPTVYGAHAQLLHAAIDVGIATGSLAEGVRQAATARPHFEADVASAAEDPTLIQVAGEVAVTVRGAQSLLADAARALDAALESSSVLFELGGTRSASATSNLSRYWRNARTHTLPRSAVTGR